VRGFNARRLLSRKLRLCSGPSGSCAQPETSWPALRMASPLFAATPVPFGKRMIILATRATDQLRGRGNQGFHGNLPDTARAVGRLCPPLAPTDSRDGGPMMPLPRPVLRYRLSAPRLAPAPRPTASLRNEQKHRGLRPAPSLQVNRQQESCHLTCAPPLA
jgi:hypothetical protein